MAPMTCAGSRPPSRWTCAATPPWPPRTCSGARPPSTPAAAPWCVPRRRRVGSRWTSPPTRPCRRTSALDGRHARPRRRPFGARRRPGRVDVVVELDRADTVRALRPDLAAVAGLRTRCVVVTAAGDRTGIDCVESRVRAQRGHPRGSRDRVGALCAGGVLGATPGTRPAGGGAGLGRAAEWCA